MQLKIKLSREEALACLIALDKERKPYRWQRQAISKIERAMRERPTGAEG